MDVDELRRKEEKVLMEEQQIRMNMDQRRKKKLDQDFNTTFCRQLIDQPLDQCLQQLRSQLQYCKEQLQIKDQQIEQYKKDIENQKQEIECWKNQLQQYQNQQIIQQDNIEKYQKIQVELERVQIENMRMTQKQIDLENENKKVQDQQQSQIEENKKIIDQHNVQIYNYKQQMVEVQNRNIVLEQEINRIKGYEKQQQIGIFSNGNKQDQQYGSIQQNVTSSQEWTDSNLEYKCRQKSMNQGQMVIDNQLHKSIGVVGSKVINIGSNNNEQNCRVGMIVQQRYEVNRGQNEVVDSIEFRQGGSRLKVYKSHSRKSSVSKSDNYINHSNSISIKRGIKIRTMNNNSGNNQLVNQNMNRRVDQNMQGNSGVEWKNKNCMIQYMSPMNWCEKRVGQEKNRVSESMGSYRVNLGEGYQKQSDNNFSFQSSRH